MIFAITTLARPADELDFSDLTASVVTGPASWVEGGLEIPFEPDPSPAEVKRIIIRLESENLNEETLRVQAEAALATNTAWRTNTLPQVISGADAIINNATATAREKQLANGIKTLANQVGALTAQNNALIRLEIEDLTATD